MGIIAGQSVGYVNTAEQPWRVNDTNKKRVARTGEHRLDILPLAITTVAAMQLFKKSRLIVISLSLAR
jgi:hypothetical protein